MKRIAEFIKLGKDGGKKSSVWGFWLFEIKSFASIAVLKFVGDSREAYHTHAFHAISWLLKGELEETLLDGTVVTYKPSIIPIITPRSRFHKVRSVGASYALTFRGPWVDQWKEWLEAEQREITLTHGRVEVK